MKRAALAGCVFAALAAPAFAQSQQIKPPIAVYWMSVETHGGMGIAVPAGLGAMMPPGMQGGKRLKLELGSAQSASGEPRANHAIPSGLSMGPSLPLVTPQTERPQGSAQPQSDGRFERPKGRMLIYWGCGETIRAGQPVIVDFANLTSPDAAKEFQSRSIARPRGPALGQNRTYGDWPNREDSKAVPSSASLIGNHVVTGNYSPEVRFTVAERHDFMAPVEFDRIRKAPGGAYLVKWHSIPTAIGYFATAMGQGEAQNDMVMWSSSDVQEMGQVLMDYLPPGEVQRLINEKVVMPPQTTECSVPAGIFTNDGAMLNFIGYGDEFNVVHPPRPKDRRQVWEQQYAVKLRLKSTGMAMLRDDGVSSSQAGESAADETASRQSDERRTPPTLVPGPADAIKEGVNILRGILGR